MTRFFATLAAGLTLAVQAVAGPWARDPGEVFLSYSVSADTTRDEISAGTFGTDLYHNVYGEVGLGRRLTFGLDLGGDQDTTLGIAFLQYTFTRNASPLQIAADIGVAGREVDGSEDTTLLRIGGSVGYGFGRNDLAWVPLVAPQGGWAELDSYVLADPDGDDTIWQSEATVGLNVSDRFGGMVQLKAEEFPDDDLAVTLSPSLLVFFGGETTVQVGGRFGLVGSEEVGARLGLWREF
ncbi:MAG: hypothetical protein AAF914_09055 [Pseudomonadota bacterium]